MSSPRSEPISPSLDELFGFSKAQKRAEELAASDLNQDDASFIPHRIFLNHVDSFNSRYMSSFLTDQFYGSLPGDGGEGEGEGEAEYEGEAMPEMEAEEKFIKSPRGPLNKFEIIGTLRYDFHKKSEDILYTIKEDDENFLSEIMKCGFIVYDITNDENEIPKALATLTAIEQEIDKIKDIGPKTFQQYKETRVFILISTVMTWGTTKPIDPDDPETPFTEADYKKRKPHPNYKEHIACEREVVLKGRKYKDKLKTYVICSGVVYGMEEEDLIFFFKLAWNNEKYLPIFQPGKNKVPFIHVKDLTKVIHGVIKTTPSKPQFILAVEQTPTTLKQFVKALSKQMGTGKTKEVTPEEAFLYHDMKQKLFERFTVNLNMEPGFIVEGIEIEWQNELNITENIKNVVNEFRKAKEFKPVKVVLHGPPGIGKSRLAKKLTEHYGCYYISAKSAIEETIAKLREDIENEKTKIRLREEKMKAMEEGGGEGDEGGEAGGEEAEEEETGDLEEWQEQLRDIESTMEESENGKLPDNYVIKLIKAIMNSNLCKNQGYVLDGYPKTIEQTRALFGQASGGGGEEGGAEEGEEEEEGGGGQNKLMPDFVISLQATDEYLCERIMSLPEREIQGTHYNEEHMLRRLEEFRFNNTEDNTMLNFFDENEVHPIVIDAMQDPSEDMADIWQFICEKIGPYKGFGLSPEEEIELAKCEMERQRLLEEQAKYEQEMLEKQAVDEYHYKMEEWAMVHERLQMEEEKLLIAESEPLRHYLMKFVFPTLAKGLIEVARIKPHDPVDFLAEYLFQKNPEGHMFDPAYTRDGEHLIEEYEKIMTQAYGEDKINDIPH